MNNTRRADQQPRHFTWGTKVLIFLGLRSECCGARFWRPCGWNREYCCGCDARVS